MFPSGIPGCFPASRSPSRSFVVCRRELQSSRHPTYFRLTCFPCSRLASPRVHLRAWSFPPLRPFCCKVFNTEMHSLAAGGLFFTMDAARVYVRTENGAEGGFFSVHLSSYLACCPQIAMNDAVQALVLYRSEGPVEHIMPLVVFRHYKCTYGIYTCPTLLRTLTGGPWDACPVHPRSAGPSAPCGNTTWCDSVSGWARGCSCWFTAALLL